MRVLNIALNGLYTDGFSYHENLLPKYHKINGHEVHLIASEYICSSDGKARKGAGEKEYIDDNGVHIYRLPIKNDKDIMYRLKRFEGVYDLIDKIKPDIIFCHLFQFLDVLQVVKYKRLHPEVKLFIDSHADYSNSAKNWLAKYILHGIIWRYCAQRALPYTERFYGVLPARVNFLKDRYGLPEDKVEFLVMGADDERVNEAAEPEVRQRIRHQYGIAEDDFLIMTGGKIDAFKTQTLLLMEAVHKIEDSKVRLIVFGSVTPELKDKVEALADGTKVQYIGWVQSNDSYDYFASCDLAVFPGRHSVFWEQVAAQSIPLLVKRWDGTTHTAVCGNTVFLEQDSAEEISEKLAMILADYDTYKNAAKEASGHFLYSKIAKRSIQE